MESERSAIIELHMAGKSPSEILKLLNIAKGRRAFIYRTINRYKETGDTVDKPRSGRPCSVTTSALKKVVRERIRRNPHRSILEFSKIPFSQMRKFSPLKRLQPKRQSHLALSFSDP
ncbi:MhmaT1 transposase [Oopsacas minuta]|uniref:MhmaT1 transposase n=1 Tax=Oopsacas minuta TaxID=111878 RepID=A0AAV7K0C1_9METZ|nr:MhmaT1 transposase [Oopsacas minuta]